jgi:hypothetical protein
MKNKKPTQRKAKKKVVAVPAEILKTCFECAHSHKGKCDFPDCGCTRPK